MLRLFLLLLLLSTLSRPIVAQHWVGSAGLQYGSYSMKSLEALQKSMLLSQLPLEIVESYPSRIGFEISMLRSFGKFSLGAFLTKASTGGRVSYADYSGSVNYDLIANNTIVGVQIEGALIKKETWELFFSLREGVGFNTMKYKSTWSLGENSSSQQEKFKSINLVVSPGFGGRVFYKNFFIHPEVRYETHFLKGDLHYSNNNDAYLEVNGEKSQVDWDGVRLSFSVGYRL